MRQWAKEAEPFSRAVAEAQYDRTQACLAEAGVDSVVIYRGVRWDIERTPGRNGPKLHTGVPSPGWPRFHLTTRSAWSCPTRK